MSFDGEENRRKGLVGTDLPALFFRNREMRIQAANRASEIYSKIVSSIGFLPTLITIAHALLAVGLLTVDTEKPTAFLIEHMPGLVVKDGDTARVLLSTIVGGMVSLTVFSFTMVMSQLNRAASSYSPRLLPGLISTRSHQIVLGVYLGTITFALFVLINIEPSDDKYTLPGLAVLVAIAMVLGCLGVFIYFIHSISRSIQVGNILKSIAVSASNRLEAISENKSRQKGLGQKFEVGKHEIHSPHSGYLCQCSIDSLKKISEENDLQIAITAYQGEFILVNAVVAQTDREVEDELKDEILSCLLLDGDELVERNYVLGFKQINEIAIRAMSPGINDPGTTLSALDHLASLLRIRMQFDDREIYEDSNGTPCLSIAVLSFPDLLYSLFAPLRNYCRHDVIVVLRLVRMLKYLHSQPSQLDSHREAIETELVQLKNGALKAIDNPADREKVESESEYPGRRH